MKYTTFTFENFPYVDGTITVPPRTVFYRGIDHTPETIIRDKPLFLSTNAVAKSYGNVYTIVNPKKTLVLVDLRKLISLLPHIFGSRTNNDPDTIDCIVKLSIAYGTCSYIHQMNMIGQMMEQTTDTHEKAAIKQCLKRMHDATQWVSRNGNPITPQGVRIPDTTNDGYTVCILKELFHTLYDGYIAPKMYTPYHPSLCIHEEIVVFDPIRSGLVAKTIKADNIIKKTIDNVIKESHSFKTIGNMFEWSLYTASSHNQEKHRGGSRVKDRNVFFDDERRARKAEIDAKAFALSLARVHKKTNFKSIFTQSIAHKFV